jgi:hypothetical protein
METSHLLIFGIMCFVAGFLVHRTFFPIIREYLILRNGHVYQVGETLPDNESIGYPDLRDGTADWWLDEDPNLIFYTRI